MSIFVLLPKYEYLHMIVSHFGKLTCAMSGQIKYYEEQRMNWMPQQNSGKVLTRPSYCKIIKGQYEKYSTQREES